MMKKLVCLVMVGLLVGAVNASVIAYDGFDDMYNDAGADGAYINLSSTLSSGNLDRPLGNGGTGWAASGYTSAYGPQQPWLKLDGWMADFGEYLPTDCVLSNGVSAEVMHNAWPAIWAKVNYEAVKEAGKLGEVVYFMRAGFTGNQKYCTLLWGGDQCVDFSRHDGIGTVIPAIPGHSLHR